MKGLGSNYFREIECLNFYSASYTRAKEVSGVVWQLSGISAEMGTGKPYSEIN